jgi:hypothetical protein
MIRNIILEKLIIPLNYKFVELFLQKKELEKQLKVIQDKILLINEEINLCSQVVDN